MLKKKKVKSPQQQYKMKPWSAMLFTPFLSIPFLHFLSRGFFSSSLLGLLPLIPILLMFFSSTFPQQSHSFSHRVLSSSLLPVLLLWTRVSFHYTSDSQVSFVDITRNFYCLFVRERTVLSRLIFLSIPKIVVFQNMPQSSLAIFLEVVSGIKRSVGKK